MANTPAAAAVAVAVKHPAKSAEPKGTRAAAALRPGPKRDAGAGFG